MVTREQLTRFSLPGLGHCDLIAGRVEFYGQTYTWKEIALLFHAAYVSLLERGTRDEQEELMCLAIPGWGQHPEAIPIAESPADWTEEDIDRLAEQWQAEQDAKLDREEGFEPDESMKFHQCEKCYQNGFLNDVCAFCGYIRNQEDAL